MAPLVDVNASDAYLGITNLKWLKQIVANANAARTALKRRVSVAPSAVKENMASSRVHQIQKPLVVFVVRVKYQTRKRPLNVLCAFGDNMHH